MKVYLNVNGERLPVVSMSMSFNNDAVASVQVLNEDGSYESYFNTYLGFSNRSAEMTNLEESLEFPTLYEKMEANNSKLIAHLNEVYEEENQKLTDLAIEAMEDKAGLPFPELSLLDKQKEYKLMQQRVFGILDTIEEVKAFQEGFFNRNQPVKLPELEVVNNGDTL